MPRNPEKNAQVREARKRQILDAALSTYIRFGYHGTDMDTVAEEARLAKGLVYYYYKTKNELFTELYTRMFNEGYMLSGTLLENTEGMNPVERLMRYTYGMFCANKTNPRMMQFFMRVPFDAYAVFGPEKWKEGAQQSDMHRRALTVIIEDGISEGLVTAASPSSAANSFWSVFVANLFEYSKLIMGTQAPMRNDEEALRNSVQFCFQGLGIEYAVWSSCLQKVVAEAINGAQAGDSSSTKGGL